MGKLLALDQASRTSGWAVFSDNNLIAQGKFTVDDQDIGQRLMKIKGHIIQLIQTYNIDEVIFEDIQMQGNVANNVQTFKILAEVYGIVSCLLTELNIPYTTVLSVQWKSTLGIKGKNRQEQKKNAVAYVQDTYGLKVTQDTADAICIGNHYLKTKGISWAE